MYPFYEKQLGKLFIEAAEQLSFPTHLHDRTELLYVEEGQVQLTIGDTIYHVCKGDCVIIFPGQIHSYLSTSPNHLLVLIFDGILAVPFQYSLQKYWPTNPHLTAEHIPDDVLLGMKRLLETTTQENLVLSSVWIQLILAHLFPMLKLKEKNQLENENLTYQLVHYMTEHFREPLTLEKLAKDLHVNKYYLSHTFSKKLQISFPKYLNHLRVEYATNAMHQSQKSLTAIWLEAGFNSQRSFNRIFRDLKGTSPLAYRKNLTSIY